MGQISSSIGLVSGINSADIIDQLISIESRPRQLVEQRNTVLESQRVAFQDVNANLLAVKATTSRFTAESVFSATTASSSNESVLAVSSREGAVPGNYTFRVGQLVSSQQTITNGFADRTGTSVAPNGGTLTFDRGDARLDSVTKLANLNGGEGIERGLIRITDRAGNTGVIDLSAAVTINDVTDAINRATGVNVIAQAEGDRLTLTDATGSTLQDLVVADIGLSTTASSLGIAGSASADLDGDDNTLTGTNINTLGGSTVLAALNDGNGVRTAAGSDFTITTGTGTFGIDLSEANVLQDVFDAIETATAGDVTVSTDANGTALQLTSASGSIAFTAGSSLALQDLGLDRSTISGGTATGDRPIAEINSKLLRSLQGGTGIGGIVGEGQVILTADTRLDDLFQGDGVQTNNLPLNRDLTIFASDNTTGVGISVDQYNTVGEFITAVETLTGGDITVAINSNNTLTFTDNTNGPNNFRIVDENISQAATSLGIAIDTTESSVTSLNLDPNGIPPTNAQVSVTNAAGTTANLDLGAARSVTDILDAFNNAGLGLSASVNAAGNGLEISDNSVGAGSLTISDLSGTAAAQLGIVGSFADGVADTGSLDRQYITEATTLDALDVARGRFRITDSTGQGATVDLTQGDENTIQDVISEINSRGLAINARINDAGNGIILEDTGPGTLAITVEDSGSTTAADLNLLGSASAPGASIDGSFRQTITLEATDTLDDVALKITNANVGVNASVIDDGSLGNPYRLALAAENTGTAGAFVFDDGGLGLGQSNLSDAQDAVAFFGGADPADALVITSTSNTLDAVLPGVTIDLLATSDQPVQITISQDNNSLITAASDFVNAFNSAADTLDQYDSYDAENEVRGLLLGDSTIASVRSSLFNSVIGFNQELTGQFQSLSQVGIRVGPGARLQFDQNTFTQALAEDRDAVEALFTFQQFDTDPVTGEEDRNTVIARGVGVELDELLDRLTRTGDGVVDAALDRLDDQIELNNDRIDSLNDRLDASRARLEAEFAALESALAGLQDQSAALATISSIAPPAPASNAG
ncbi:MAG: flagellar filament capping protein FliD [Planctomycetota bacterium]